MKNRCKFVQYGAEMVRCLRCGRRIRTVWPPVTVKAKCCIDGNGLMLADTVMRQTPRQYIEQLMSQHIKSGKATQTYKQIDTTLDNCFGGCSYFNGQTCTMSDQTCKQFQHWVARLTLEGCSHFTRK